MFIFSILFYVSIALYAIYSLYQFVKNPSNNAFANWVAITQFLVPLLDPLIAGLFFALPVWLSWNSVVPSLWHAAPQLTWGKALSIVFLLRASIRVLGGVDLPSFLSSLSKV